MTAGCTRQKVGAIRAQKDWSEQVRPVVNYQGGLGDSYSFIRVTVAECLPGRLEIISCANEFVFLYDGTSESSVLTCLSNVGVDTEQDEMERLVENVSLKTVSW